MGEEQLDRKQQVLMGRPWVRRHDQDRNRWQGERVKLVTEGALKAGLDPPVIQPLAVVRLGSGDFQARV